MATTTKPKILVFAGSTRKDSLNKKLARAAAVAVEKAGGEATFVDLRDLPMPFYDGDLEAEKGLPENAKKFKALLREHQGFIVASPEYNSSISGVLKNSIDWASRAESKDELPLVAFKGKAAALLSASPGALGGLRGLAAVRSILGNIGVLVLPQQVAVSKADEAFAADGTMKDARQNSSVEGLAAALVSLLSKLA